MGGNSTHSLTLKSKNEIIDIEPKNNNNFPKNNNKYENDINIKNL